MKKLQDYVTLNEQGEPVFDEAAFNADVDRERNSASETARANAEKKLRAAIEAEIRKSIEDEAKLTAEQKVANDLKKLEDEKKQFETLMKDERKKLNVDRIRALYKTDNLFADDEIESLVSLISDDYDASVATANKFVEARKKRNDDYEKSFVAKLQGGQKIPNTGGSNGDSEIMQRAKSYSISGKDDIVQL